jgi:hypothetical protein
LVDPWVIRQVRSQGGREQLAVIADTQMQQLVDDHAILKRQRFAEQFVAERDAARR